MSNEFSTPEVFWAQRSSKSDPSKNFIYLTISVPDVPKEKFSLDLQATTLKFKGYSATLKRQYQLDLEFFAEIDEKASQIHHTARDVEIKLIKKELKEEYWPRLLQSAQKVHFLKTDFDKWVDEDEQNEAAEDDFSQFGGMGGMPGMGGDMTGGDFGGIDFSKLGGGPGAMDEGADDDSSGDDDDDDMPALEEQEDAGKKVETK